MPTFSTFRLFSIPLLRFFQAYKTGASSPTQIADKILAALPYLQDKFRMFSSYPLEGSVESDAAASTARYSAGSPLSVWDGVPVAFKDMLRVKGYVYLPLMKKLEQS